LEAETVPRTVTGQRKLRTEVKKRLSFASLKRLLQNYGRRIALRDITWVYLAIFLICAIESQRIYDDPNFTVFKVIFQFENQVENFRSYLKQLALMVQWDFPWDILRQRRAFPQF
jgi:hypothetical protein